MACESISSSSDDSVLEASNFKQKSQGNQGTKEPGSSFSFSFSGLSVGRFYIWKTRAN